MIRHLDLFSGIGGFALAARMVGGVETVGFCEIDPWARRVLAKNFPGVPVYDDVTTLQGTEYGTVELITGGYPCQPFSHAGKRGGQDDDRHLWPQMRRIINEARPRYVLAENVAGHVSLGLDQVLSEMESDGYTCGAVVVPACAVDAPHRRDRVWVMAHARRQPHEPQRAGRKNTGAASSVCREAREQRVRVAATDGGKNVGHADSKRLDSGVNGRVTARSGATASTRPVDTGHPSCRKTPIPKWDFEPPLGRVAHGVPKRLDRLRGLGNAIVPQVAAELLRVMLAEDDD